MNDYGKRLTTAIHDPALNVFFCKECHTWLYVPGTQNKLTGYPEKYFWFKNGAGNIVCAQCYNKIATIG